MPATAITIIHKYLRSELFGFSQQLFRAGPEDVSAIQSAMERTAWLLHGHATQEEAQLEPKLRQQDEPAADRLMEDHRRLEEELEQLTAFVRRLDPGQPDCVESLLQLNLNWNRFVSGYLAHLDDEERALFQPLSAATSLAVIAQSAVSQGAEQGRAFLERLWTVTTVREREVIESEVRSRTK